ncbi:hypothetical protein PMI01_03025 [Caulobacter sp. AP07]|uniref:caspase family protein n=1 Tax=Caulobacter sp. AP07 TaxID=1144304 RepID=UPI000271EDDA|nr:caspase family protein [Caulobacter sp. AP07]EJL30802.1 hypothetical protein PMI01_03025 [Caulobacter sp. AP07]
MNRCRSLLLIAVLLTCFASPAFAARRAFLVGIATYPQLGKPLDNPVVDIEAIAPKLTNAGYIVTTVLEEQASKDKLITAFDKFLDTIDEHDEVLVYYSGHGLDIRGENMFVPYDSPSSQALGGEYAMKERMIPIRDWMEAIEARAATIQVWIVDACRENPYAGGRPYASTGGLRRQDYTPTNSFILYSAKYTQTSADKLSGEDAKAKLGSPFSRKFVTLFDSWKGQDINLFALELRRQVVDLVKPNPQFPTFENAVLDQWCFDTCSAGVQQVSVESFKKPNPFVETATKLISPKALLANQAATNIGGARPAVFLGKLSAADCKPQSVSDLYPFGCSVLKQVAEGFKDGGKRGSFSRTVTVSTPVYVRRGLPTPGDRGTDYGCKIRVLKHNETVKLASSTALQYAGDTFYWGTIDGPEEACSREASLRNPAPAPSAYR